MSIFKPRTNSNQPDMILLIVIGLILLFGLIMLSSASVAVGLSRFGDGGAYIKRQLVALVIGLVGGYYCYRTDYHKWQNRSFVFFIFSLILLLLVFFPIIGAGEKGAQRWLDFYFLRFQPSELAKLSLILYLSAWFSERGQKMVQDFKTGLVPFAGLMTVLFALVIAQPDLGTLLVIIWIGMALYFMAGAHIKHFGGLILTGIVLIGVAIKAEPYRFARVTAFLNPSLDPQGTGYHITQALIAIGSGGWFGVGLGHSRQKFMYLPEVTGDSLFAVIAEELGFVFCVILIGLFLFFLWRGIKVSRGAIDEYGKLVAIGITTWIVGQAFLNIGAMTSILPLTGVPLPLMSSGGTSLMVTLMALGILLNISKSSRV